MPRYAFNPDQARDDHGRWTDGAGGGLQAEAEAVVSSVSETFPELKGVKVKVDMNGLPDSLAYAGGDGVYVSGNNWNAETLTKYAKEWDGLVIDTSPAGVIQHELGHVLVRKLDAMLGGNGQEAHQYFHDAFEASKGLAVSPYAGENASEFAAESFAAWQNGTTTWPRDVKQYDESLSEATHLWTTILERARGKK